MTTPKTRKSLLTPVAKAEAELNKASKAYRVAVEAEAAKPENQIKALVKSLELRVRQLEQQIWSNAYARQGSAVQLYQCNAEAFKSHCNAQTDKPDEAVKRGTKDAIIDRILDRVRAALGRVLSLGKQKIKITIDTSDK